MAKIISIVNFKGGVGKTTVAVNLAACLSQDFQQKTLLVDLDAQASASQWLLAPHLFEKLAGTKKLNHTSVGLFTSKFRPAYLVTPFNMMDTKGKFLPKLQIIPASRELMKVEDLITKKKYRDLMYEKYTPGREYKYLKSTLRRLAKKNGIDYIVMDCPPTVQTITKNAVHASDFLVIPCIPDEMSTLGLKVLMSKMDEFVRQMRRKSTATNHPVLLGVAINKKRGVRAHDMGLKAINAAVKYMRQNSKVMLVDDLTVVFDDKTLQVPDLIVHAEAVAEHKPLCLYRPNSSAAKNLSKLTEAVKHAMEARK